MSPALNKFFLTAWLFVVTNLYINATILRLITLLTVVVMSMAFHIEYINLNFIYE